jgi:hypothetical protein
VPPVVRKRLAWRLHFVCYLALGDGGTKMNRPGLFVVIAALIAAVASSPWL